MVLDGRPVKGLGFAHKAVVKADYRVHCVACASIVAKVCRDRLMDRLHARHPQYGWDQNRGYGTEDHRAALARLGPSPHHRRSFEGVEGAGQAPGARGTGWTGTCTQKLETPSAMA